MVWVGSVSELQIIPGKELLRETLELCGEITANLLFPLAPLYHLFS